MRLAWLALSLALAGCGSSGSGEAAQPGEAGDQAPGPLVTVSGKAFVFGPSGGTMKGATITVAESPDLSTVVGDDGAFAMKVPSRREWSFVLRQPGYHDTQTAALSVPEAGLDQIGFQVPTDPLFKLLSSMVKIDPDPERCQIATTVSAAGTAPYGGSGLGEPDVTVSIEPALPAGSGPVYFKYIDDKVILPDLSLTATTIDGGVLFTNVPVGDYRLTAHKPGKTFTEVKLRCRAGVLVNAAPPRGLQEL